MHGGTKEHRWISYMEQLKGDNAALKLQIKDVEVYFYRDSCLNGRNTRPSLGSFSAE
jgi:hypothetical protein